jgi:SAM-dependent methyltransferase
MSSSDTPAGVTPSYPSLSEVFLRPFMKLAAVQTGERVLDVASAGPAAALEAAARAGDTGELVVVRDNDDSYLAAEHDIRVSGQSAVHVTQMDPADLRLGDGYWDVALCHLGLTALADPEQALREMTRVLRPVGRVAVSVLGERGRSPLVTMFVDVVSRHLPAVTSEAWALFRYGEPGKLANLLAAVGFQDAVPDRLTEWVPFRSVDDYWEFSISDGYGAIARQLSPDVTAACKAEIEHKIRFYRRGDHFELKVEAILLAAVR